ncbi:MAG: class I SAM-dependent methyltransferase [Thiobacillus sp.]|nr:class I SAM-dependent methyltransferase [Thiobacillus sp.]
MTPADYDAWYDTPRGRWVGDTEYALAAQQLAAQAGESLLDVGCGTGWFTRHAAAAGLVTTGLDPNPAWLEYARAHSPPDLKWVEGDARALPFESNSFDHVLSIAALCFVKDEQSAVAECVRVARKRVSIGWLNRHSLLYRQKGRDDGSGAYRGAHWRTASEVRALFDYLPVRNLTLHSAIFLPSGSRWAQALEARVPRGLLWGGLLLATAEIS